MLKQKNLILKILVAVSYLAMVTVNALANILPINNISTGEVSNMYSNLFAPAGLTFSIWGLIYLLLGLYVLYQFGAWENNKVGRKDLLEKIGLYFILSSIANIMWIFAWHYDYIGFSVLLIIVILGLLIKIANLLRKEKFLNKEKLFLVLPFSVYFGWITVAMIANISTFLVSINWSGWGLNNEIWTVIILIIGAIIGIIRMFYDKNIPYGLVFIWAYLGILIKHISFNAWDSQYPLIIATVVIAILAFIISQIILIIRSSKKIS
jgi:hypothetical protein